MPRELCVTNTNFGGRPGEAAVTENLVHKGIPRQKIPEKQAIRGGRVSQGGERQGVQYLAVLTMQIREKECLALQTTCKTRLRNPRRSV